MTTDDQLRQIMPNLKASNRQLYLPFLNLAMTDFEINTPLREAAFLAQIAHESGEFRWMEEIWGPTTAQKRYDPPSPLALKLGNLLPGDGKKYKGRGPIQITGKANYKKYGDLLGVDLVGNPDLASTPQIAFATAGLYWKQNGLNELADAQDFVTITKRINGGVNGLPDRQKYYERAKKVLGIVVAVAAAAPLAAGAAVASFSRAEAVEPVSRGHEEKIEVLGASAAKRKPVPSKKAASKAGKPTLKKAAQKAGKKATSKTGHVAAKKASKKIPAKATKKAAKKS